MSEKWRKTLAVVLALGLALFVFGVSGCAQTEDKPETPAAEEPVAGGTFVFGDMTEPAYIDPYNAQETSGVNVESNLFDSLVAIDPIDATKLLPAAAESWEPNGTLDVWTFKLNPDGKFSDGTPVKAQDFVFAWNRIANPKEVNTITKKADPSVLGFHLESVKGYQDVVDGKATTMSGLKAVDDLTLEVTLSKPYADFEFVVAHPALAPVPQKYVEGGVDYNGTKVPFGEMPIGNGPFKMSEPWKHEQYIKTVKNENYYGEKGYLDGVDYIIFKDTETEFLEFQAGNLDFSIIGQGQIETAKTQWGESPDGYTVNPGEQVLLGAFPGLYYIEMNNLDPVMKNIDVRRAVSLAINRQAICDVVWQGTRVPADGFVPPGIGGHVEQAWPDAKYDVEAAKAALEKAGFPGGEGLPKLKLSYNADGQHKPVMELVQSDLATIGVTADLNPYADFASYLKASEQPPGATVDGPRSQVQFGRMGWVADYPTPANFLLSMFITGGGNNYSGFSNKTIDDMMSAANAIADTAARSKAWEEINKKIGADTPVAPLAFYRNNFVGSDRVHGFVFGVTQLPEFGKTWLTNGGQ